MSDVNPNTTQLISAFLTHYQQAQKGNTLSHKLVCFYASECGLKAYYLRLNNLQTAEQGRLQKDFGHNIYKLLRECNIPQFVINEPNTNNGNYPIKNFHECMRYGCTLPPNIESNQLNYLKAINNELKKHL